MKLTSLLLIAACAFAADPVPKPMSELHAVKFENLIYRQQSAQQALEKLQGEQRALYTDVCKAAGIEAADFSALMQVCSMDLEKRTVTKKDPPKPDAPKK